MFKKILFITVILIFSLSLSILAEENALMQQGGGGSLGEILQLNVEDLNHLLMDQGFASLPDYMITYGGGLATQTDDLRYSNFGSYGSVKSTAANGKTAKLSLNHWGVWLEKMLPLGQTLAVSGGAAASFGRYNLELTHAPTGSWSDVIGQPNQSVLKSTFLMVKPQVGFYYSLKRYVDLELKLGYYYAYTLGRWKQGGQALEGDQMLKHNHGMSLVVNVNFGF